MFLLCPCLQVCLEFLPQILSKFVTWKFKPNKPFSSQVTFGHGGGIFVCFILVFVLFCLSDSNEKVSETY